MKILWVSNAPWSKTGYGVQTNMFTGRLTDAGHPVAILCYYGLEGGSFNFGKTFCFPKAQHPYGMDIVNAHAASFKADVIFTLMDTWVITPGNFAPFKWIAWYPVDHEPMPGKVRESIMQANYRVAMSKSGVKAAAEMGLDSFYVPHGVDTNLYKPMDKAEARKKMNLPEDAFIVGTVAMNKGQPSRKNFHGMLQAFANFKRKHTDAIYYIHTQEGTGQDGLGGVNIPELCQLIGLRYGKDVLLPNPYGMMLGFPDEAMVALYSAMDVHLLASMGEGFGIPIIEAQACGCPVIVGGWTSMPELVYSGHIIEKSEAEPMWTGLAANQYLAHIGAIERKLHLEYKKPSSREAARKGMVENYDAQLVFDKHMLPTIQKIEKRAFEELDRYKAVREMRDDK
jgi:glycosyltransferase involved in cell wall biosynthesis